MSRSVLPFLADRIPGLDALGREWSDLAAKVEPFVRAGDDDAAVAVIEDHPIERLLTATADPKRIAASPNYSRVS